MYLLENTIRPYAWGSRTAIAELLGRAPSGGPEAELWIGAHPGAPSVAELPDGRSPLDALIDADPDAALGAEVAARFGRRLPYLMKVLAAGSALSLQVHPSTAQAEAGFDAEESAGVPADAPERNYKDRSAKPEMVFALSPFEALCGFRPLAEAAAVFSHLETLVEPGSEEAEVLGAVAAELGSGPAGLRSGFEMLLAARPEIVAAVEAAVSAPPEGSGDAGDPRFTRDLATVAELGSQYPGDPGVLIALLLNRVSLQPGEVLYLPAGNIHAYLSGLGIEVMASSDNVLRGGLTPKHVDTRELLRTVVFEPLAPPALQPERTLLGQELYRPPFAEFQLQRIALDPVSGPGQEGSMAPSHVPLAQHGPTVVLAVSGSILIDSPASDLLLTRGQSAFIPAGEAPVLVRPAGESTHEGVLAFAVTVGSDADGVDGA
ncbi:mannose-6-phosphate isomerase, class I [Arthrobacter frigidicola]|nr:mannose-6-phosphate isomerase, class I [Arthrobacter frigidicola]